MSDTALFDPPGPRARRRIRIYTTIAIVLLLAVAAIAARRYSEAGQFSMEKWGPIVDPSDPNFPLLWANLWAGLLNTVEAAVLAIALALFFGIVLTAVRMSLNKLAAVPLLGAMEVIRGLPLVVTIYFVARVLPDHGITLDFMPGGPFLWYLVIALCVYNTVVISEILRAGVNALPKGQMEAALASGLTRGQAIRLIVLPQAIRIALPAIISQVVIIVKDTSLAALVLGQFQEFLRTASLAITELHNPLQLYFVVAVVYILLNLGLSLVANWFDQRNRSERGATARVTDAGAPGIPPLVRAAGP